MTEKIKVGMKCPNCGRYLDLDEELEFYKCSWCEWEVWPPERDDTPEKLAKAAREAFSEDVARVGYFGNGGKRSSGSRGKSRKKKLKALFTERYRLE